MALSKRQTRPSSNAAECELPTSLSSSNMPNQKPTGSEKVRTEEMKVESGTIVEVTSSVEAAIVVTSVAEAQEKTEVTVVIVVTKARTSEEDMASRTDLKATEALGAKIVRGSHSVMVATTTDPAKSSRENP